MSPNRLRTGGYLAATLVMLCVAAMSWSGLFGWARHTLHWAPVSAGMVPIALDVAALTCALLALDTVSKNEPATMFRALTACLIGLSAFVNWRYRLTSHNVAEEVFFPAMSVLAYLMIDATIRKYRRGAGPPLSPGKWSSCPRTGGTGPGHARPPPSSSTRSPSLATATTCVTLRSLPLTTTAIDCPPTWT